MTTDTQTKAPPAPPIVPPKAPPTTGDGDSPEPEPYVSKGPVTIPLRGKYTVHGDKPKARKTPRGNGNNAVRRKPLDDKSIPKEEWQRRHRERYDPNSVIKLVDGRTGHGVFRKA